MEQHEVLLIIIFFSFCSAKVNNFKMAARGEPCHFPPVRLWGLDALFWSHMKLFVKEIQYLQEVPDHKGMLNINNYKDKVQVYCACRVWTKTGPGPMG